MILLHLLTTRAALALADPESADWLCRERAEDRSRPLDADSLRGQRKVDVFQHADGVTRA